MCSNNRNDLSYHDGKKVVTLMITLPLFQNLSCFVVVHESYMCVNNYER